MTKKFTARFICRIIFFYSILSMLPLWTHAKTQTPYLYPQKQAYAKNFSPVILSNSSASYPLVFLVSQNAPQHTLDTTFLALQNKPEQWSLPYTALPHAQTQSLLIISQSADYVQLKAVPSWSGILHHIEWNDDRVSKRDTAHKTLQQRKASLHSVASALEAVLSDYQRKFVSPDFLELQRIEENLKQPAYATEKFLSDIFLLMDQAKTPFTNSPHLLNFRTAILDNDAVQSLKTSEEETNTQREQFNTALINSTEQMTVEDSRFFIENIYSDKITLDNYYAMRKILNRLHIDFPASYPAYNHFLYTLAWQQECRNPAIQNELHSMLATLNNTLLPQTENQLLYICLPFKQSLSNFLYNSMSYDDFTRLKSLDEILSYPFESLTPSEQKLSHTLSQIFTQRTRTQLTETLNAFSDFVSYYKKDAARINELRAEKSISYIYVLTDTKDSPAWHFWFSSFECGSVIAIEPALPEREEENKYFDLMRGHRSPFEKLLEGIEGEKQ